MPLPLNGNSRSRVGIKMTREWNKKNCQKKRELGGNSKDGDEILGYWPAIVRVLSK